MKASDLRVGSILNVSLKSGQGRTLESAIRIHDLVNIYENSGSFNYEPIPLTEEWLLKFGFEITSLAMHTKYDKGEISLLTRNGSGIFLTYYQSTKIKYVHHLQTLYWCLCGEELTIGE
jgi:hypothetical protein